MNITKISKSKSEIICPSKSILVISANYQPETLFNILKKNPNLVNIKDQKNETFLSYAIKRKNEEISKLIISIPLLDISYKDSKGNTYLHLSIINKLINLVELLIKKGININSQNNEGNTALHYAYNINNIQIISTLISNNADINIKNNKGLIPSKIESNSLNNDNINPSFNDICYKSYYEHLDKNISIQLNNNENMNNTKLSETNNNSFKYSLVNFSYSDDDEEEENKKGKKEKNSVLDIPNTKSEISDIFNLTSSITYKEKMKDVSNINSHTIGDKFNIILEKKNYEKKNDENENINIQNSKKDFDKNNKSNKKSDNIFFEYSTSISKEEKDLNNYNNKSYNKSYNKYIDQEFIFSPFVTIKEFPYEINNNTNNNNLNLSNDSLYIFLSEINLEKKYYTLMNSNGFEEIQLLIEQEKTYTSVTDDQLKEIGILLPGDRAKILIHLEEKAELFSFPVPKNVYYDIKNITNINNILDDCNVKNIFNWLKNIKIENYLENFIEGGYYSIELILMQMNSKFPINDNIIKDELGILKVGHRARLINKLIDDGKKFGNKLKNSVLEVGNSNMDKNCECIIF